MMARSLYRVVKKDISDYVKRLVLPPMQLYSASTIKKTESSTPTYTKKDHEYKITKKGTIQTLEQLLQLGTFDALNIVSDNKCFKKISGATLKSNHALFLQRGITRETMLKYPQILTVSESENKLQLLATLKYDINTVALLLLLSVPNLLKLVEAELEEEKISVLSSLLQVDTEKACELIATKPFLCTLPTKRIQANINILMEHGITPESICNDLWVLKYSEELIANRLSMAKQYNMDIMKTWMVRAQQEVLQIYVQRRSDNKSILGNSSLAEYLSERLECSVEVANYLIKKQPALQNKSLKKLKELIDLLFAEGFNPQQICRVPKILIHSVDTTRKRLKQLTDNGIKIDSLSLLTKSQNQFMQYYEALLKNKNKQKNKT